MLTRTEFAKAFSVFNTAYPDWKLPNETKELYYLRLRFLPLGVLLAGILECIDNGKFYPYPQISDIRRASIQLYADENCMSFGWAERILEDEAQAELESGRGLIE